MRVNGVYATRWYALWQLFYTLTSKKDYHVDIELARLMV